MTRTTFVLATLVVTLRTGAAAADSGDLAVGASQLVLGPRSMPSAPAPLDATPEAGAPEAGAPPAAAPPLPFWRAAGFVQVTAGSAAGPDVGVGAAAAVAGFGCDLVSGAVQGRLRPLADQRAVGSAQWGFCLSRIGFTFEVSGVRERGVAPALDGRQSLWRRRYDASYQRLVVGGGELVQPGSHHRHALMMFGMGHGTVDQHDELGARAIRQLDLDLTFYWYHYVGATVDAKLDVLAIAGSGLKAGADDHGGVTTALVPVRASIDGGGWFASAHGGWGLTGAKLTASSQTTADGEVVASWSETIDGAGLPQLALPIGGATLGVRRGAWTISATAARTVYPTFDSNVAAEARVAAQLDGAIGATTVSLAPFATQTQTWTRDDGGSVGRAIGATAAAGRRLDDVFRVDVYGELGLSPYARLGGDRAPVATLGGQVLVALTARAER
ncbi:MAG: hypothetical protein R3B06_04325 [Kofleriaceae bacterium]